MNHVTIDVQTLLDKLAFNTIGVLSQSDILCFMKFYDNVVIDVIMWI